MINLTAMDMGLSIGFFALIALLGSLNYSTLFSLAPFMNNTAIDIIGILLLSGAMAKSAQIPLHSWLPGSMEGFLSGVKHIIFLFIYIFIVFFLIYSYHSNYNYYASILPLVCPRTLQAITGNMLGDGNISLSKKK